MRSSVASVIVSPATGISTYSSPRRSTVAGSSSGRGSIGSRRSSTIPPPEFRNASRSAVDGCPPVTTLGRSWQALGTRWSAWKAVGMVIVILSCCVIIGVILSEAKEAKPGSCPLHFVQGDMMT
jgi:hypothetical protein